MRVDFILKNTLHTLLFVILVISGCHPIKESVSSDVRPISENWKMQSSEKIFIEDESLISQNDFIDDGWFNAVVPGTILGSMVTFRIIEDPYFGINMQSVSEEQFKQPWWYRTIFRLNESDLEKNISLRFNGINYRADLWVNGQKVAGKDEFAGAYRMFTFNINNFVKEGENTLALKVWQPANGEYSIGFVDWNPAPPDRNMGIFREVFLEINEGIKIRSPFVWSKVNTETLKDAELFIQAEVENNTDKMVEGILRADFGLGKIEKKVKIEKGETLSCRFTPDEFAQLSVTNVKLWWPNGMGEHKLYPLKMEFIADRKILDRVESQYGIREIDSYLDENENRVFTINGKFVLIKGGGWVDDLLLQDTRESIEAQIEYICHMNLNAIRCEGFWGKDQTLYDLCDEYGILVMIGWSCHWEWEEYLLKPTHEKYGGAVFEEDINLLADYWEDQMLWLRHHPGIFVWMLGSDKLPAPELERKYIELFYKYDSSRPYVTSAGGAGTENNQIVTEVPLISDISGPTGMKMLGPYAFTPPVYWFTDTLLGGAYGFNTESCPGPNIMPLASLKKMLPEESLWPIDTTYWEYHTGRNVFKTIGRFRKALDERYGKSNSVHEFAFKSQVSNYELMRPMFEAFIAHKPKSTGLIQWKLNSAWPELYWQLYDTYLQPNGSFYAVRKACSPIHAIYRYGLEDIYLANESLQNAENLIVKIEVFDIYSKEIFSDSWTGDVAANTSKFIYKMPEIKNLTSVWFLNLQVFNKYNNEIDDNIYWLSLKPDVLDYDAAKKLEWPFYTPTKEYADFTALDQLPIVDLLYDYNFEVQDEKGIVTLNVKNRTSTIAFFLFFDLVNSVTGKPVLPILWSDNYVTLFPGDDRTYSATIKMEDVKEGKPLLKVEGWNVKQIVLY